MKITLLSVCMIVLLASCGSEQAVHKVARPTYGSGTIAAVWDLEDASVVKHASLSAMQEFLTAKVIETLKDKGQYELIERQKLLLALEELNLGSSALASETSRLRVGEILGAQLMVFGGYQLVGNQLRIDLRVIEVETGTVIKAAEQTTSAADVSGWLKAAEEAAVKLL